MYGRGVADNKGHVIQNLTSIKRLIEVNKLKNNIVFILEGEEEVGSENFDEEIFWKGLGALNKIYSP